MKTKKEKTPYKRYGLQNQVTTQEISIKIKDLGITEPSIFYRDYRGSKDEEIEMNKEPYFNPDNVNCYTVAELGEIFNPKDGFYTIRSLPSGKWVCICECDEDLQEEADTEADARGKMLCCLKENNLKFRMNVLNKFFKNIKVNFYAMDIAGKIKRQTEQQTGLKMKDEHFLALFNKTKELIRHGDKIT